MAPFISAMMPDLFATNPRGILRRAVIGDDRFPINAQRFEDQRAKQPCTVLAGSAVDEGASATFGHCVDDFGKK